MSSYRYPTLFGIVKHGDDGQVEVNGFKYMGVYRTALRKIMSQSNLESLESMYTSTDMEEAIREEFPELYTFPFIKTDSRKP